MNKPLIRIYYRYRKAEFTSLVGRIQTNTSKPPQPPKKAQHATFHLLRQLEPRREIYTI